MKKVLMIWSIGLLLVQGTIAQENVKKSIAIHKISKELLAGEGLDYIKHKEPDKTVYQKKVYDGETFAIFMVAIGTNITNKFESFPLEEFIFWKNGKAIVTPDEEKPFEVQSGDYFIQAKGFKGSWNFVDIGGVHLELSLIAKNRAESPKKSPILQAIVIDRNLISGVHNSKKDVDVIYQGAEVNLKLIRTKEKVLNGTTPERLIHILNGVVTITDDTTQKGQVFYPGDFFIIPNGFKGSWHSDSLQDLRMFEVSRAY